MRGPVSRAAAALPSVTAGRRWGAAQQPAGVSAWDIILPLEPLASAFILGSEVPGDQERCRVTSVATTGRQAVPAARSPCQLPEAPARLLSPGNPWPGIQRPGSEGVCLKNKRMGPPSSARGRAVGGSQPSPPCSSVRKSQHHSMDTPSSPLGGGGQRWAGSSLVPKGLPSAQRCRCFW